MRRLALQISGIDAVADLSEQKRASPPPWPAIGQSAPGRPPARPAGGAGFSFPQGSPAHGPCAGGTPQVQWRAAQGSTLGTAALPGVPAGHRGGNAPLLDPSVLAELDEDVPGAATRFASAFIRLWDSRSSRLEQAPRSGDPAAALDAVLSVKSSSALAGALRLSSHAAGLELALRTGTGDVVLLCGDLLACGEETLSALGGHLGQGSTLGSPAAGRR